MEADAHARTMSTSWGWAENTQFSSNPEMDTYNTTMQSVDKVFSSMVGEGWTLLAASGDNGATDGCGDADRVDFPSSDPNVIAVGGTTLNEGSGSNYEVAWTGGQFAGNATQQDSCVRGGLAFPSAPCRISPSTRPMPTMCFTTAAGPIWPAPASRRR